jgi:hypothetical protein
MEPLTEHNGMAEDGVFYFATKAVSAFIWNQQVTENDTSNI